MKILLQFIFVVFLVHVLAVKDGDTIQVSDTSDCAGAIYNIRLYGIDAPEKKQDYGLEAKAYLTALLQNKDVRLQLIGGDLHGRLVCKVLLLEKNLYVNENLVASGYAWYYEAFAKNDNALKIAQDFAQKNKLGLWKNNNPVAPWDYRKQQKEGVK